MGQEIGNPISKNRLHINLLMRKNRKKHNILSTCGSI